jgi:hypothetical protein
MPGYQFQIVSRDYALAFMIANLQKLVNLTPEAEGLLTANGYAPKPGTPQSPKRYGT